MNRVESSADKTKSSVGKTVLVTGGAGYIGSHTCKALHQAGYCPVTVDNLISGHEWAVKWGPFHRADVRETQRLTEIMKNENVMAVIHFAAFAYVGESVSDPLKYYDNNLSGTLSLLKAMQSAQVNKIIFSSTCATYGTPETTTIHEETPQVPVNPYGRSKLMIEQVLKDMSYAYGLQSVSLRYFNAAGADSDLEIGEDHKPETHLIPLAIQAAYRPENTLTIFGEDYPTFDGTCVRDYIHVSDLADAHVRALSLSASPLWRAYNLGGGCGYSVREVVTEVEKITGRVVKIKLGERRPGDPPQLVAGVGRAKEDLGWEPTRSSLENILKTAVRWHEKHFIHQGVMKL